MADATPSAVAVGAEAGDAGDLDRRGRARLDGERGGAILVAVDVEPVATLKQPVTLAAIKADKAFASFPLVRMPRLSVMPVTEAEWKRIEAMAR